MSKKRESQTEILKSYKVSVAANGRINIPSRIRQMTNIKEGDEIIFEVKDRIIHLVPLKKAIEEAQMLAAQLPGERSLTEEWQELRRAEMEREEGKGGR